MSNSDRRAPRRVEQRYDSIRYEERLNEGLDRRAVNARRFSEQTYATEFPRYQKILLAVMTGLVLILAASNSHASQDANTVYQTVGSAGEVSFNNVGDGVPVDLAPPRVISAAQRQDQLARQAEIVALADRLESERRARSLHRAELALRANASSAARANEPEYSDQRFFSCLLYTSDAADE